MDDTPHTDSISVASAGHSKRGYGLATLVFAGLLGAILSAVGTLSAIHLFEVRSSPTPNSEAASERYQCPMHPAIVQDHPGNCPICGMQLVKVDAPKPPERAPSAQRKVAFYRSPMDPKQTSPSARKDEMGMDYLPVYSDELTTTSAVAGLATVEIDPTRQQLIGLQTAEVTRGPVGGAWRTVGRVAIDETRVRHVNLKIAGFVERIYVDFVGKTVSKGDPLFSIYSPELFSAQEEYLLALKMKAALSRTGTAVSNDGDALLASARRRLALWDVPETEIERVAQTGAPDKTLTFYSPVTGVVTRKDVVEGMKLDAGAMPYEIVDLSSVWVLADVYESELRFVKTRMAARLKLNAFPDREFKGRVVFVDPMLDPRTRTVKVRLTFPNPTGELRPEMFGDVVLLGASHDGLRIAPDAVIDSGTEKLVFVALGEGKFQPRIVKLGDSDRAYVEVVSGLELGERVVTRANFLIDSESRLRASLSEIAGTKPSVEPPQSARVLPPSASVEPVTPPPAALPAAERPPAAYPGKAEHQHGQ